MLGERIEPATTPPGATTVRFAVIVTGLVLAAKFATAAVLPLFYGDEPYYWLWSRHLAWGYFDHPPAIAVLIRAGTELFGQNEFGVRFFAVLLSLPLTLCLWRTGTILLGGVETGALAALIFNLTIQANIQTLFAGPDAAVLACLVAFMWTIAEAIESNDGRWWLAAGFFAGLGLLAKYAIAFVGAGVFVWLVIAKEGRAWLKTPWPWLGGIIAVVLVSPNLIWNMQHEWGTFAFQFGRVARGGFRWHYLPQFIGEQLLFASPLVLILAMGGLWRATRSGEQRRLLIAALIWPTLLYFLVHTLHARVHRGWTDVIYPALALAAADAIRQQIGPRWLRAAAVPVALVMIVVPYGLVLSRALPLDRIDPMTRESAAGMPDIVHALQLAGARGIVTTDFQTTSWLRFYLPSPTPIIQIEDDYRFADARHPDATDFSGALIYVGRSDVAVRHLQSLFSEVEDLRAVLAQDGAGLPGSLYVYRLGGFKAAPLGRMP